MGSFNRWPNCQLLIITVLTLIMPPHGFADQNDEDAFGWITNDVAELIFDYAWPTATYVGWQPVGIEHNGSETDVTISLVGLSNLAQAMGASPNESKLQTDAEIVFINGQPSNLLFTNFNSILAPPGQTSQSLGHVIASIANSYHGNSDQSSSDSQSNTTQDSQNTTNAPSATAPPPVAQSATPTANQASDDYRNQAWQFLTGYWATTDSVQSQSVPAVLAPYYSDPLMYYGKETRLSDVLQDKTLYTTRWPTRQTTVLPDSVSLTCVTNPSVVCTAIGLADYSASSPERNATASGVEKFDLNVLFTGSQPIITEESSIVVSRN